MRAVFGLVLIVGVALAGGAVYMARNYISAYQNELARQRLAAEEALANAQVEVIPTVTVFVSNRALRYGERLTQEDIRAVDWPENAIPEGTFSELTALFPESGPTERFVLRTMEKDEAIMAVKITEPGEKAGLTSRLEKGMRAFAISVDVASGVSGFLRPGDNVDIYWTGTSGTLEGSSNGGITRLIEANVQLIAVDQTAGSDVTSTTIARTVTVAATPQQVAALAQAQNSGRLSLALVGVADESVASTIEVDQRTLLGIQAAAPEPEKKVEEVCTTRIRRGGEIVNVPIPCTN
ncbi:Flp pilus assembly protein CpaB [Ruegeria sp. HKCCD4884]|uniref:Flp pilus assembly protein CpaB n=1 Tax=Ruegeria sp. HKCCD4884 TaxID=2683022 RepID=UPI001490A968|nr:Flp pilus assembly protein CpaB [Ruegeria sp. HKCCD4884]NOD93002.1 Flp pilus assembly protein CpaB [Ruegeria sp. HKCCD4884]